MAVINLRDYYPCYKNDEFVEVSDDVAAELQQFERNERSYQRKCRYHLHYSLDRQDGIAQHIVLVCDSAETHFEQLLTQQQMESALSKLPDTQARRIHAHFFLGQSFAQIARSEGVHHKTIRESINLGLARLGQLFQENF